MDSRLFSLLNTSISDFFRYGKAVFCVLEVEMCRLELKCHREMALSPYIDLDHQFCATSDVNISKENDADVIKISQSRGFIDIHHFT
jgi:hypothetical protein